jgi:ATP-dependent Clp protease protease subunit
VHVILRIGEHMLNLVDIDRHIKVKTHSDLLELPHIIHVKDFDPDAAIKFVKELSDAHETGQEVIPIIIDSYGGQVYSLMTMVDAIRNSRVPIATIVEGKAMSCGAVLLTCGQEGMRFAAPNATVMIHEVSSGSWGKVEEIKVDAKETDRLNIAIMQMMAENCGKPKNYFLDLVHEKGHADWFLTAQDAKQHNVVNHVRVPALQTKVKVISTFE